MLNFMVKIEDVDAHPKHFLGSTQSAEIECIAEWLAQNGFQEASQRIANFDHRRPVTTTVFDRRMSYNLATVLKRCLGVPLYEPSGFAPWQVTVWNAGAVRDHLDGTRLWDHVGSFAAGVAYLRDHKLDLVSLIPDGWELAVVEQLLRDLLVCANEYPNGTLKVV